MAIAFRRQKKEARPFGWKGLLSLRVGSDFGQQELDPASSKFSQDATNGTDKLGQDRVGN